SNAKDAARSAPVAVQSARSWTPEARTVREGDAAGGGAAWAYVDAAAAHNANVASVERRDRSFMGTPSVQYVAGTVSPQQHHALSSSCQVRRIALCRRTADKGMGVRFAQA